MTRVNDFTNIVLPMTTLDDKQTKHAINCIILTQCIGLTGPMLFGNEFILSWLNELGLSASLILILLTIPNYANLLLGIPAAYAADRIGKKRFGLYGLIMAGASFPILALAGVFNSPAMIATAAISLYGIGWVIFGSGWFGLLSPIIPPVIRGRFFAKLRICWQLIGIVMTFVIMKLLNDYPGKQTFIGILLFITILMFGRLYHFLKIPEIADKAQSDQTPFIESMKVILREKKYISFCIYVFISSLLVGPILSLRGLLAKKHLMLDNSDMMLMGNLVFFGSILGFFIGGKTVDKFGARKILICGHASIALFVLLFTLRIFVPVSALTSMCLVSFLVGAVMASNGIAFSAEMFALTPSHNRALGTTFLGTATALGWGISILTASTNLKLEWLPKTWELAGHTVSDYDTILLATGFGLILTLPALRLIPKSHKTTN